MKKGKTHCPGAIKKLMQRVDQNRQIRLSRIARSDEHSEWAQFNFCTINRSEIPDG